MNGRNQSTSYKYDVSGRTQSFTDAEGTTSYSYDANGNLLTVTKGSDTITREYDALNRATNYSDAAGNKIGYNYDKAGNLIQLTYPNGKAVKYEYNANDKLTKVTDWNNRVTAYAYDSRNRLTTTTRPDGSVETVTYDNGDQPLTVADKDKNGTVINQYSYTYDANGNVTSENDNEDAASLLTPRATGYTNMTYGADNKLDTYNGTKVQYDADGNMLQGPLKGSMTSFSYDSKNRVTQAGTTTYGYDAEDNRISLTDNGKTTKYVINPEADMSQVLVRTDSEGKSTYYIYGLGLIGEEQQDGSYFSYHFDRRGSTTAITDINGNVTDKYIYGPYGEMVSHSGNSTTPFMFNGKDGVMTDSNGLYYMRSRYYNPDIKRFINMDVVRESLSDGRTMNRYAYANGNPISMVDPFGTSAKSDQADYLMKVVAPKLIQEQNSLYDSMNTMLKISLTCAVLCPSLSPYIGAVMEAMNVVTAAMDYDIRSIFAGIRTVFRVKTTR